MAGLKQALVSCVHIPVYEDWQEALETFDGKLLITNDGEHNYDFETLKGYENFPLYEFIHKSSASKNYALYKAYQEADITYIVDSDCIIPPDFQEKHLKALSQRGGLWDNPLENTGFYSRGYPYSMRDKRIVANMGLWTNVLDINGQDRNPDEPTEPKMRGNRISNSFIPLSGMNLVILREAIPALFFLPNIGGLRRHDDIFGGYIFQSIAKKKGDIISYGEPFVYHKTEVCPEEDIMEETETFAYQEEFIKAVDEAIKKVKVGSYKDMYKDFVNKVEFKGVLKEFIKPMKLWVQIFQAL
jgi:hypothetical protein